MHSIHEMIDRAWVNFDCPKCGFENDCRVQQAALEERLLCRGCHETIQLIDKDASTVVAKRQIDSALNGLRSAFRNA